jgi:hypothetical protein
VASVHGPCGGGRGVNAAGQGGKNT